MSKPFKIGDVAEVKESCLYNDKYIGKSVTVASMLGAIYFCRVPGEEDKLKMFFSDELKPIFNQDAAIESMWEEAKEANRRDHKK